MLNILTNQISNPQPYPVMNSLPNYPLANPNYQNPSYGNNQIRAGASNRFF